MTVQDETVHMGPRTAGNKSLMSFRTGVGVSGYVGYIPSCDAIPIPIKNGPNEEPPPGSMRDYIRAAPRHLRPNTVEWPTEYYDRFGKTAQVADELRRTGQDPNGSRDNFAMKQQQFGAVVRPRTQGTGTSASEGQDSAQMTTEGTSLVAPVYPKQFLGTTIYRDCYTAPVGKQRYRVLEPRWSALNETEIKRRGLVAKRKGVDIMRTSYGAGHEANALRTHGQTWLQDKDSRAATASLHDPYALEKGGDPSAATTALFASCDGFQPPRGQYDTAYIRDHGHMSRPRFKMREQQELEFKTDMCAAADTLDLFAGSTKAKPARIPQYSGFLPECERKGTYVTEKTLLHSRDHTYSQPKGYRMFALKQYSYHIPGFLGHQPRDSKNCVVAEPPSFGMAPTETHLTTSQEYNNQVCSQDTLDKTVSRRATTKLIHPVHGTKHTDFGNSMETLKFFTPGADMVSDNGVTNAQTYYKIARPWEGLPRQWQPSATTVHGYNFDTYTSRLEGMREAATE